MTRFLLAPMLLALLPGAARADDPHPPGNVPALLASARPLGPAEGPMARMLLALKPPPGSAARLHRRLARLQDPGSPDYHRWLTPEQFGAEFGPGREALDRTCGWLRAGGFSIDQVAAGRLSITFSGTVAQVERAFRTPIRRFLVAGQPRQGNLLDPAIPGALADVVAGVVSLHNLPRTAQNRGFSPALPAGHHLTPGDFAAIYRADPLYQAGIDGTGVAIAIVGRTRIPAADPARFRQTFGLPPKPFELIVNGPDPGDLGGSEDGEADLDVEWAGAVARNADLRFVASASTAATDGVDLSAQCIVDHNLAPILTTSFGQCEPRMGAAEQTFYKNLWAQAAAQGITVVVASGDSGPAGCDPGQASSGSGRAVSGLASTPYNVAVGGTQFDEGSGSYWQDTLRADGSSALGYIPERAWNESAATPGGAGLWASGGGTSVLYPKPDWQTAPGVPANTPQYQYRCLPDVALAAALSHDGYLIETGGSQQVTGGTSCSAPAFAGLMALVVQKHGRQGNASPALYALGNRQYRGSGLEVFHDITAGASCVPGTQGYDCRTGYDLATGLGSLDAWNLVQAWTSGTGNNVEAVIRQPATDRTIAAGTTVAFQGTAADSSADSALGYAWDFGDGSSAQGAACSHSFANPGTLPITNLVTFTARDGTGAQGSDTRAITVLPPPVPGQRILNGGFELDAQGWSGRGVSIGDNGPLAPGHQGRNNAWFPAGSRAALLQQTLSIPATAASARLTFWLHVDTRETASRALDCFQVKARGTSGQLAILASYSNLDAGLGYQQVAIDLGRYRGQELQLSFVASDRSPGRTTGFALDDVSLIAP
ncbi:MAG: protease pro-enzyme activation domain-containing protein [Holophaga sp.]|nr:protease pro-enzyme activation domain-containing protein [Holophaga sp.]